MSGFSILIWTVTFLTAFVAGWTPIVAKADVRLNTQLSNYFTSSKSTYKDTGQMTSSDSNQFKQLYHLDIKKNLYPNLAFTTGGVFQSEESRNKTSDTTTITRKYLKHPYIGLDLYTPLYGGGIRYDKSVISQTNSENTMEQVQSHFLWTPIDLPRLNLDYSKSHYYNNTGTSDLWDDGLNLNLRYDWRKIFLNYSYSRDKTQNPISGNRSRDEGHNGSIRYSHHITDNLEMNTGYQVNYETRKNFGSGPEFLSPLNLGSTSASYLLNDINPASWDQTTQTTSGGFLLDGVKSGSSNVNLGQNGDYTQNKSIILDFGFPTNINTIRLWVDRDATDVANNLKNNMTVYTSADNLTWTAISSPIAYVGGLDNYFEFTLSNSISAPISTRYIKVDVTPLSMTQDPQGDFHDLFVTEIGIFDLNKGNTTSRQFGNNANAQFGWRINPKTNMVYRVSYLTQANSPSSGPLNRNTRLSQNVSLGRTISRKLSGTIQANRNKQTTSAQETTELNYGASFNAAWLGTFRQTLSYSGAHNETDHYSEDENITKEKSWRNSMVLRSMAKLYRGWSANLDLGYSWSNPWGSGKTYSKLVRLTTSIAPNQKLKINSSYSYNRSLADQTNENKLASLSVSLYPTDAVSLFMRLTQIDQGGESKLYQNYSVGWSPLPGGTMQFLLAYHENLNSNGSVTKSSSAGIGWMINRSASLHTTISSTKADSLTAVRKSKSISMTLNLNL